VAPSLSKFRKDEAVNLICCEKQLLCHVLRLSLQYVFNVVCPTHHHQFDSGRFVLVPSKEQRELLLEHEHRNFAMREEILARGGGDPGRTFPQVSTIGDIGLRGLADTPPFEAHRRI
jgi:hypothetical protein